MVHTFHLRAVVGFTFCSVFVGSPDLGAALRPEAQSSWDLCFSITSEIKVCFLAVLSDDQNKQWGFMLQPYAKYLALT